MKMAQRKSGWQRWLAAGALVALSLPVWAEPISFQRVIELALQNHGMVAIAQAEERKSQDSLREARNTYLPSVTFGSGLGYSYGVPLSIEGSAPSIFNVTTQQFLLNFSQRDLIRAARFDVAASRFNSDDKRESVILEAALSYIELDSALNELKALQDEQKSAERITFISTERMKEGVDSPLDLKKSQLSAARVRLRLAQVMGNIDVLRERLARMSGIAAASIETMTGTIPKTDEIAQDKDYAKAAVERSPAVKMAEQRAQAAQFRAQAEKNQRLPSIDFASQYAMLSKFNNYEDFYKKFSRNNYSFGLAVRFPILNFSQGAKADTANEDAIKAKKELEAARAQVSEQTLTLQRSLRQLAAAAEVARLDYEVTSATVAEIEAKLQSGETNSRDLEQMRINAGEKFFTYQETNLEYQRAQLQMLRSIGEIQSWALGK